MGYIAYVKYFCQAIASVQMQISWRIIVFIISFNHSISDYNLHAMNRHIYPFQFNERASTNNNNATWTLHVTIVMQLR